MCCMDEQDLSFHKARRNLIGCSLVLLAFSGAGLTIDKLVIFGNEVKFSSPDFVLWVIFTLVIYSSLRFAQLFMYKPDPQNPQTQSPQSEFISEWNITKSILNAWDRDFDDLGNPQEKTPPSRLHKVQLWGKVLLLFGFKSHAFFSYCLPPMIAVISLISHLIRVIK